MWWYFGLGVPAPDPAEALRWFTIAAECGSPGAQAKLKGLHSQHFELLSSPTDLWVATFQWGVEVELVGLTVAPELNGRYGRIRRISDKLQARGRVGVYLKGADRPKMVRYINLRRTWRELPDEPAPYAYLRDSDGYRELASW